MMRRESDGQCYTLRVACRGGRGFDCSGRECSCGQGRETLWEGMVREERLFRLTQELSSLTTFAELRVACGCALTPWLVDVEALRRGVGRIRGSVGARRVPHALLSADGGHLRHALVGDERRPRRPRSTGRQGHHENTRPSFVRRARASPGACSSMRRAAPWRRERLRALG